MISILWNVDFTCALVADRETDGMMDIFSPFWSFMALFGLCLTLFTMSMKSSPYHITSLIKKLYPYVSDLPGLLLLFILAVHSASTSKPNKQKIGQEKPSLQNPPLAAFYHFGAS